jgi:hypothetical protein
MASAFFNLVCRCRQDVLAAAVAINLTIITPKTGNT